ncbi:hypothetical protein DFR58_105177 [Anaerobacterium chartisolvens]|uniref:DUF454 domain-containing protein n=1 Tax=Anaerobacterium chartisolvens TaxID=1297424 RepID=A0A369BA58_9FIRM|nr:YbaN family protein [Anaerobacterium chartisolvens]RCX18413.1 hypothetical protein DFR58_105177 [Anaerobacterium chartisolvens]
MKKIIYVLIGILSLALGLLGAILPGLPTTPFLLLTLYCFTRGSERMNHWFKGTRIYKKYLYGYERDRSLPIQQKLVVQLVASSAIAASFIVIDNLIIRILLAGAFVTHHYVFLFVIKTRKQN